MNDLHKDFADFVRLVMGEKEANGAAIQALLEAYRLLSSNRLPAPERPMTLNYSQPWQVYEIRNTITGRLYVGRAAKGFLNRYPDGAWWFHHNEDIGQDIVIYGLQAFQVRVFQCVSSEDMCTQEYLMYVNSISRYNKNEPPTEPLANREKQGGS